MVKKTINTLCDYKAFFNVLMKISITVCSVLITTGVIWMVATVNANDKKIEKTCTQVEQQDKDIEENATDVDSLTATVTQLSKDTNTKFEEINKNISQIRTDVAVQSKILEFLGKKFNYKEEDDN